ncbi:MAG TPA: protein-disulfide reductase DsbD domain-containing protein [Chthonomonadaceae bacterium]|nr:protein-disulfide reductase DsbD domain-containing protein [Chthonomonadaceae bacterium]
MKRLRGMGIAATLLMLALALGTMAVHGNAQPNSPKFLTVEATPPKSAPIGKQLTITVALTIADQYHLQGHDAKDPYIPTVVTVGQTKGFKPGKVVYPASVIQAFSGEKIPVYVKTIQIKVPVTPDATMKPGKYTLPVTVSYQGCNQQSCYPPDKTTVQVTVNLTAK